MTGRSFLNSVLASVILGGVCCLPAWAAPYGGLAGGVPGGFGPGLASPSIVPGKEYSHDKDETSVGVPDAEQIIAWDGSGGTADGIDFTPPLSPRPLWPSDDQIDAIANRGDHLFSQLHLEDAADKAHLIFSHDDMISVYPGFAPGAVPPPVPSVPFAGGIPAGSPPGVTLSTGLVIGGSGELSFEVASAYAPPFPPATLGLWAGQAAINSGPLPLDVDGVELWGPEPPFAADTDKYSLELDYFSGVSVWNGTGTAYISHATIVSAVTSLLGPVGAGVLPFPDTITDGDDAINLDALMVQDIINDVPAGDIFDDTFDPDPAGGMGDRIYFSIRQIVDPTDVTGYYATGSEIFVLEATPAGIATSFLHHGGHFWDKAYALSDLSLPLGADFAVIDINAIEAISEGVEVPEPSSLMLLLIGTLALVRRRI